jgi:hypothetical protein
VSASRVDARRGGSGLTFALAVLAVSAFGLVVGLPDLLGPAIGVAGLVLSSLWRRRPTTGRSFAPLPALVALSVLAVSAPVVASAELFGGFATLALLLWLADDPARPAGGGRRAARAIGACGLAIGIAWSLVLLLPSSSRGVGVAGALLALVLLVLAYLLVRETEGRIPSAASA